MIPIPAHIIEVYKEGEQSYNQVAKRFQVSRSSVKRFIKQWRNTGVVDPKPSVNGSHPKINNAGIEILKLLIEKQNDLTQEELRIELIERIGISVSQSTICRTLKQEGLTL